MSLQVRSVANLTVTSAIRDPTHGKRGSGPPVRPSPNDATAKGAVASSWLHVSILHLSGNANTHSVEPPSGFRISGTSVDNERPKPDPLPVATATYCLPLTL